MLDAEQGAMSTKQISKELPDFSAFMQRKIDELYRDSSSVCIDRDCEKDEHKIPAWKAVEWAPGGPVLSLKLKRGPRRRCVVAAYAADETDLSGEEWLDNFVSGATDQIDEDAERYRTSTRPAVVYGIHVSAYKSNGGYWPTIRCRINESTYDVTIAGDGREGSFSASISYWIIGEA